MLNIFYLIQQQIFWIFTSLKMILTGKFMWKSLEKCSTVPYWIKGKKCLCLKRELIRAIAAPLNILYVGLFSLIPFLNQANIVLMEWNDILAQWGIFCDKDLLHFWGHPHFWGRLCCEVICIFKSLDLRMSQ